MIGISLMALGSYLIINSMLGASPVGAIPNVISTISTISLGNMFTIVFLIYVLLQAIILRKITVQLLLQIPFSIYFGSIVDVYGRFIHIIDPTVLEQYLILYGGITSLAIGIVFVLHTNIVYPAPDGFVAVISKNVKMTIGRLYLIHDIISIAIAFLISYIAVQELIGFNWGTLLAAISVGPFVDFFDKLCIRLFPNFFQKGVTSNE